jgi:hypothetical protein
MTYRSSGEVSTLHDRAHRATGGPNFVALQRDHLRPASDTIRQLAVLRVRRAVFRVGARPANWDGYGSVAPDPESVARAATIVEALVHQAAEVGEWFDPLVGSDEFGHLSLEWWKGEKKLTLFVCLEATEYLSSWGHDTEDNMSSGSLGEGQFVGLWRWLVTSKD